MLQCPHPGCLSTFSSQHGRTRHFRSIHAVTNGRPIGVAGSSHSRKEHPHLTALPCNSDGNFLPPGTPPQPRESASEGGWAPFANGVQFQLADLLYRRAEVSNGNIDVLLQLWTEYMSNFDSPGPFESHEHMYRLIDSSVHGDVPWQCLVTAIPEDVDESSPSWMRTPYEVWYRNPDAVVSAMLSNPDFQDQFDLCPYIDVNADGTRRRWSNVMSGNIAWRRSDEIFAANPGIKGAMYCPIILGSDKTVVSVGTGHVEYHPLYISIGNIHNTVRRAHRNAVIPIAFLAIPTCERRYDDTPKFQTFKRQLYHASVSAVLSSLRSGMTAPVIRRCPDGHFRRVIYDLIAFIADYPEQVLLTGIVTNWCPKCTALPANLDACAIRRTQRHTNVLTDVLSHKELWVAYGIHDDVEPFTSDFPRADIYEMISPDLLHQLIKGTFKDHLVTWVCEYLVAQHGPSQAGVILDDIDRRISAVPPFPGLRRFPHGRRFKQWTGDDSKALMKVYLPAIVGYVPEDIILCLGAFMEACYITRRQCIDSDALDALDNVLENFRRLREVFRTSGVRSKGFSLPRQHVIFHYRRMIENFGAPGGLCSSITESRHITAVKKPWRRSNRYQALGQMLLINQRLDKLAAMRIHFAASGLLPGGRTVASSTSQPPHPPHLPSDGDSTSRAPRPPHFPSDGDGEDDDGGPVEEDVLGHVVLARTPAPNYPKDIEGLSHHIGEPDLHYMTRGCISHQLGMTTDEMPPLKCKISVFHSAVATFYSPSDPCGTRGMRRERIRSTPSWRGREPRRDCAFVVEDDTKPGMLGMAVVRVQLLFSFIYEDVYYPCALVEWFTKVGCDRATGLWVVRPDIMRGKRVRTVVHLDCFLRAAHLIPVYGNGRVIPLDFHYTYSLDAFHSYYVNKYIDHHANEIAF
ncbi:hypothetical protein EDB92DRAFT_1890569 [Lactarius akahatsu]|uniref:C2H2-type domain-containing protein n=1 Tax=Lactarius akahatsu TaxID=416441 RepID=A0AAD4LA58_9AGAM|nr:hypothetical protein EDB92DRAFT_1890569 [Lactarius akahatsu]